MRRFGFDVFIVALSAGGFAIGADGQEAKPAAGDALPPAAIQRLATDSVPPAKRNGPGSTMALAISADSKFVATGENRVVKVFERSTGKAIRSFPVEPHQIMDLAFTPDGKGLLVAIAYHPARLWNLETGKETRSFNGSMSSVRGVMRVAFNADASVAALAVPEPSIHLIDPANGKLLKKLGEKLLIDRFAFSPDGRLLAAGGFNQALHLWDVNTGKEKWIVPNGSSIAAIAYSPNGKQIATGDYGALRLRDADTGKLLRYQTLQVGASAVRTVAFSPDGRFIAAAGDGHHDAIVYEAATGTQVLRLTGHKGPIWFLAFSPDAQALITGSNDTTALVWDITGRKFVKLPAAPPTDADLKQLWADLAKVDGTAGTHAAWKLTLLDKLAIPFLDERMRIKGLPDAKMVAKFIANLDHEDFAVREDATKALVKLDKSAAADLRRALGMNPTPEAKARLEALLRPILDDGGDPRLRAHRVLSALEHMTSSEARKLLEHLAAKETDEGLRQETEAALKRIKARATVQ